MPKEKKPTEVDKYPFRVAWSEEDGQYVGTCEGLPSLSWLDKDRRRALDGIVQVARGALREMSSKGETPPALRVESPAYRVVRIVWDEANGTRGHSWMRYNHALADAVSLGVRGGLRFDVEDFRRFLAEFRGNFWFGESGLDSWYHLAVVLDNLPAAKAIEQCWDMAPYTIGGRRLYSGHPRQIYGEGRKPCHLHDYTGHEDHRGFYVTSLHEDHVIACRFQDESGAWQEKPVRRMKLTRAEVAELDRAVKDDKKNLMIARASGEKMAGREVRTVKAPYLRFHAKLVEFPGGGRCLADNHGYRRGKHDWRELAREEARRGGIEAAILDEVFGPEVVEHG